MNPRVLLPLLLVLALAGCARDTDTATDDAADPRPPASSTTSAAPSARERITPGAVAVLVEEHLGAENVREHLTYGPEPGSVDLMVRLEGAGRRDMFSIGVYGPGHAEAEAMGGGPGGGCRAMERQPSTRCTELAGGGLASVFSTPYGFSDDNAEGSMMMGQAYVPQDRMAIAMYESYSSSLLVDEEDLLALMSDPRLAWETDAELVEAGRDVVVRRLRG